MRVVVAAGYPVPMLSPGSTVAVVAPCHPFHLPRLERGIALVESWGLRCRMMDNVHARHRYLAGTRQERLHDLTVALTDPDIDAVWFARGGSGTVHLLDGLPWDALQNAQGAGPVVIGFSDATSLLSAMWNRRIGRPIHGPVLHSIVDTSDADSAEATRAMLLGEVDRVVLDCQPLAGPSQIVEGPVVAGNLCVLASLCGTPWQLDARGCILVLEDIGEWPYQLDRLVTQLRLSGALDGVLAIALGDFSGGGPPADADWTVPDVLADLFAPLGVPVVHQLPVGHGLLNQPIAMGAPARLSSTALSFEVR